MRHSKRVIRRRRFDHGQFDALAHLPIAVDPAKVFLSRTQPHDLGREDPQGSRKGEEARQRPCPRYTQRVRRARTDARDDRPACESRRRSPG
jgi:ribosomal protein L19E